MAHPGPPWQPSGPYQAPWQGHQGPPVQRVNPGVLAGVSAWRLLIAVFALYGFSDATGWTRNFEGLSQQASLFTGIVYIGLLLYPLFTRGQRHEPESPWLRGATTVLLLLVMGTFFGVMGGSLKSQPFEHLWTPLVVLIDWIFVGRNQARTKWWHPLTWIAFPLAYLVYFLSAEVYRSLYRFLNPTKSGFAVTVLVFLVAVIAVGYALYGIAKLKTVIAGQNHTVPPQGYGPPAPQQNYGPPASPPFGFGPPGNVPVPGAPPHGYGGPSGPMPVPPPPVAQPPNYGPPGAPPPNIPGP
ncbi:hypothetical protein [Allokutzneria oryzae]|uniref:Integral membrane protein n=1 Tax=Allokutzneria oryzae TaxID=1378989 RepID=A0ABV5ZSB7_9PSEU